jgi:hypothetical protein
VGFDRIVLLTLGYKPTNGKAKLQTLPSALVLFFSGCLAERVSWEREDLRRAVYNFEVEGTHNYFVGKEGVLAHNADCKFYQKLLARIEGNSNFAMIHSSQEVADIAATGKSLGLTDDVIDDLLYISCREAKKINANELMIQIDNWVNIVQKRGYPYRFKSLSEFVEFKILLGLLVFQ